MADCCLPAYSCGPRLSFNARSHKMSGLRSPPFASSMIFGTIACLTSSAQSPVRRAIQVISRATPRARSVSGSNRETLRYGWMGMVGGDQRDAEVDCIPDVSLWHCCATAAHINANLRSVSRCLGSLACSAAFMLSCANQSNTLSMSMVGGPA
jgi:hypothetical protein